MNRQIAMERYVKDKSFAYLVDALAGHLERKEFTGEELLGAVSLAEVMHARAAAPVIPIRGR